MATSCHQPSPSFGQQGTMSSPLYQRRGVPETGHTIELLPNPEFVFPARSPNDIDQNGTPSPSLISWNALNRRPHSAQQVSPVIPTITPSVMPTTRSHRPRGSAALPTFSFNPSAPDATTLSSQLSAATPPISPTLPSPSPTTPSSRGTGHKRGGSEFIGGDGKGGAGLMSCSPTKMDPLLPTPRPSGRLGPPPGAGHRHRRSGAISYHDLQSIMQPKEGTPRAGSAPVSPLESDQRPFFASAHRRRVASQADFRSSPEPVRSFSEGSSPKVVPRVRVGFSDRVEYIRPLSTISSETEGSFSTVRGGHSVSGSLSSVISLSTSSPPSQRMVRPLLDTTFEDNIWATRPQSSGIVLDAISKDKRDFQVQWCDDQRPKSAACTPTSEVEPIIPTGAPRSPKRKSFSWWESKRPTHVLRSSISEPSLPKVLPQSPESTEFPGYMALDDDLQQDAEKQHKVKKGKSWTRVLTSRKSKSHNNLKSKGLKDRPLTPPTPSHGTLDNQAPAVDTFHFGQQQSGETDAQKETSFEPDFDIDDTVTIVSEESRPSLNLPQWKKRLHADSDPRSPVIDLDAALGPFNTPPFGANSRGSPTKVQPRQRRSLHSLGYQANLNHRRTESAPELVPFDMRNAKAASATAMPDVFEEEDEEAFAEISSDFCTPTREEPTALGITVLEESADAPTPKPKSVGSLRPTAAVCVPSNNSLAPSSASDRFSAVEVVEDFEEPRTSSFTRDSDSTITPPLSAEDAKAPRPIMSLQLPPAQQSIMTPDTLTGSSFSSRHFSASQISLNGTPRLGTATSSTTDDRSLSFGEPGPAMRVSVDDVPSLSSSRSTMTTPPQAPFMFAGSFGREGRASSIASVPSFDEQRQRSKRASVASLSRLVGVRSKLSIETRPQSQHATTTTNTPSKSNKKLNRLSKLMQFWKKQPDETPCRDSMA